MRLFAGEPRKGNTEFLIAHNDAFVLHFSMQTPISLQNVLYEYRLPGIFHFIFYDTMAMTSATHLVYVYILA